MLGSFLEKLTFNKLGGRLLRGTWLLMLQFASRLLGAGLPVGFRLFRRGAVELIELSLANGLYKVQLVNGELILQVFDHFDVFLEHGPHVFAGSGWVLARVAEPGR